VTPDPVTRPRDADQLLPRDGLERAARQPVLTRILDRTARARRPIWLVTGLVAVACSAGAIVLWVHRSPARDGLAFTARATVGRPLLDLACINGRTDACPLGATLVFGATGATTAGYIGAWAEPATPGREPIWYFSADNDSAPVDATTPLPRRAIRLGPEHRPGPYIVHVLLSTTPLPRSALLAGADPAISARASFSLTVTAP
jgi:hypothetical protein